MSGNRTDHALIVPVPTRGMCRWCFTVHEPWERHEERSIVYQRKYRIKYGAYPQIGQGAADGKHRAKPDEREGVRR